MLELAIFVTIQRTLHGCIYGVFFLSSLLQMRRSKNLVICYLVA